MHSLINYHFNRVLDSSQTLLPLGEKQGSGSRLLSFMFPISLGYTALGAFSRGKTFAFRLLCLSRVKQDFAEKMLWDAVGMVKRSIPHLVFVHVLTICINCLTIVSFSE